MDNFSLDSIVQTAKKARAILEADPSQQEWMNEVAASIDESGEIPEDTWNRLSDYFLKHIEVRNEMLQCLDEDNGEQLMLYIFNPQEIVLLEASDDNEEEEENVEDDLIIKEEQKVEVHKTLTIDDFKAENQKQIQTVSTTLNISPDVAYCILMSNGWITEKAISSFLENNAPICKAFCLDPKHLNCDLGLKSAGKGMCDICCDEDVELFALQCGHAFCANCWKDHIENKVLVGQADIRCQQAKCNAIILLKDVEKFCGKEIAESFHNYLIDNQISMNPHLKRCVNPRCQNLLTIDSVGYCMVASCPCGAKMCWRCGEVSHAPCSCENKEKWLNIADDDKIAAKWMHENTKLCPKCKSRIEKNGGCNHMTCWKCHYEFCWICGHEWASHGGSYYECNRYKPETGKGKNELITDNVDRLSHYFARYQNHSKSLEMEEEARPKVRERLIKNFVHRKKDALQQQEAEQLADEIFKTIKYSRSILLWSYPFAYYMKPDSVELNLFEHVQKDVEVYLEELTDLVENGYTNPPQSFQIPYKILAKNVEVLLKHVESS